MAVPEVSASRQPRLPQAHTGASARESIAICPTSAAAPLAPTNTFPPSTMPAPTPVLKVTYASVRAATGAGAASSGTASSGADPRPAP